MSELRARKKVDLAPQKQEEEDNSKAKPVKKRSDGLDLEPNIFVVIGLIVVFIGLVGSVFFYKFDNRDGGPFAAWVNKQFPIIDKALNRRSGNAFGAYAQETTGKIKLTEEDLKEYDGTSEKPIYLAIDGTIFDVSVSPAFYGPGGHYHHFVGKDATRAWITECWDEPEQFTWRLDDVEVMFMNKYLDEDLEAAGKGDFGGMGELGDSTQKMVGDMAKKAMEKLGTVTDGEKEKRRKVDAVEANAKVKETLNHWKKFFSNNPKYKVVGEVILDETRPAPPKPCKKAMEKRPLKGGKLEKLMGAGANIANMGGGAAKGKEGPGKGPTADYVKALQDDKKKKDAEEANKKKKEAEKAQITPAASSEEEYLDEDYDHDEEYEDDEGDAGGEHVHYYYDDQDQDDDDDEDVYHEEL